MAKKIKRQESSAGKAGCKDSPDNANRNLGAKRLLQPANMRAGRTKTIVGAEATRVKGMKITPRR